MADRLLPGLYLVSTPIGNLGDLSPRAAEVLGQADLVLVEDTRVTAKLLRAANASTPMRRYDDHSSDAERDSIIERLTNEAIALVSDAGTPLISDPGFKLVRSAREAGRSIVAIPGPSAAIAALTLSGLPSDRFLFGGFLPVKAKARSDVIAELAGVRSTLIFFESPNRLSASLSALAAGLGNRRAAVAREITKLHEECVTGELAELAERFERAPARGEIAIVVAPPDPPGEASDSELDAAIDEALERLPLSRAAAEVAERLNIPRKRAYARALERAG